MVFGRNRFTTDADKIRGAGPDSNFDQSVWFRLIDPVKGLVWLHQIPDTFDYSADKPFFHMFSGKSRMFGFRFDEDVEAAELLKKVTSNVNIKAPTPRKKSIYANLKRRLTPSMVSGPAPGSFVHVAHVGLDSKGRLEAAEHMGHEWTGLLEDLEGHGVSRSVVEDDRDFVEGFITGVKAVTNSPSLSEQAMIASDLVPVTDEILLRKDTV
ncbi:hypothetical protein NM688_g4753 [Phlebia brevispora]|uniref:Uncharacterized protein n=1 Tax=Phlebia brevispora TaxID=194682 RepID=A0ACC1T279_9APHY|nr:hypothetical protein NM688_g4753 [Phlebia brevispora]